MFHMSSHSTVESLFRTFLEIITATAMYIHCDKSRYDIHTFGINHRSTDHSQVAVSHFQYFTITDQDGTIFQPTLRCQDLSVYYLCQHNFQFSIFNSQNSLLVPSTSLPIAQTARTFRSLSNTMISASFPRCKEPLRS